jgi:hypothetical protein
MTLALHPERYRKLLRLSAVRGRNRCTLLARAFWEGHHPGAILTSEDLCSQRGPLVSPDFLREEFYPLLEWSFEPLYEVSVKVVWQWSKTRYALPCSARTTVRAWRKTGRFTWFEQFWQRRTRTADRVVRREQDSEFCGTALFGMSMATIAGF